MGWAKEKQRANYWKDPIRHRKYQTDWFLKNKEKVQSRQKGLRMLHLEETRARERAWYAANKERLAAKKRAWRKSHPESVAKILRNFALRHPEKTKQKRRNHYHRRRALTLGNKCTTYSFPEICKRDGWICQICKRPVIARFKAPHPLSATRDHIIPVSLGGSDSADNIQLAHWSCNSKKQQNIIGQMRFSLTT